MYGNLKTIKVMNHEEYLLNEAYERSETPLNDPEPTMYFVVADGGEITFTTIDLAEATEEYNRVVMLNEGGDSDDYAVDLMSCDGDYFNEKTFLKTISYSDLIKGWKRN